MNRAHKRRFRARTACGAALAILATSCTVRTDLPEKGATEPNNAEQRVKRLPPAENYSDKQVRWAADESGGVEKSESTQATTSDLKRPSQTPKLSANDIGQSVKKYILSTARDPASVEFIKWHPIQKYEKGFYIRCQYRTAGGSFGIITEDKVFYVNKRGRVVRTAAGTRGIAGVMD